MISWCLGLFSQSAAICLVIQASVASSATNTSGGQEQNEVAANSSSPAERGKIEDPPRSGSCPHLDFDIHCGHGAIAYCLHAEKQQHNSSISVFFVICGIMLCILLIHSLLQNGLLYLRESVVVLFLDAFIELNVMSRHTGSRKREVLSSMGFWSSSPGYNLHKGNLFQIHWAGTGGIYPLDLDGSNELIGTVVQPKSHFTRSYAILETMWLCYDIWVVVIAS